jgi:hypothetical protein
MTGQMGRFLHQSEEKKMRLKAADDAGLRPYFNPACVEAAICRNKVTDFLIEDSRKS